MSTERSFDAVSLGILWDRLISVTNEIVQALVRTSFSTIARENYDLSCVLFDAKGRSIAQGTMSVPVFIGTAPQTMRHMLDAIPPESLKPGDVILTNDIWMGTGHLWDLNVMQPAFKDGRIVGFAMSISHLPDIGGRGFSTLNENMYEEGLQIPITRIVRAGEPNVELIELIRKNVRVSEQVIGDLMANIAATDVGCRQLVEFMDDYGIDDLVPLADAIIEQSEAAMRQSIAAVPDGVYRNEIKVEAFNEAVTLACAVQISGDRLMVDFEGTGPMVPFAINVPLCYTKAMAAYAIKALILPHVPNNAGSVTPVEVKAPAGCILNAVAPAATGARFMVGHFIAPLIFGAIAKVMPERVQADSGMTNIMNVIGRNPKGQEFTTLFFSAGGFGAMAGLDGLATTPSPSNMMVMPTETWEVLTGIRVLSRTLRADSGGAGEFRGGLGQEIAMRNDTRHALTVYAMGARTVFPALGSRDGKPGALRSYRVNGKDVQAQGRYDLKPGDHLHLLEAGGGGYGDPALRDRSAIAADIERGFVTLDAAKRDYGYVPVTPAH
ncbi:hydantoinase B/oxoprolinase family protein [Microvirga antarctica]|uniref:hydantoinase B/oxoprolinase family protein n=1 Tax=Microvirga antarctica TaxID=2819233 RepID=UPI001B3002E4|nr:hydantoinase B/oxoprolinase family protein [Microvirga antarctica]